MKKVFLDIGAHTGETLGDVGLGDYLFDEIHCFEPMAAPFAKLKADYEGKSAAKVFFHNFGLSDFAGVAKIYGVDMGASQFADKVDVDDSLSTTCQFRIASDFFQQHLSAGDLIIVKINCEGGEVSILNNLLDSGEIFKANHMMVDFDARKIPSLHAAPKAIIKRLKEAKYKNYALPRGVMKGKTTQKKFRNWFSGLPCAEEIMKRPPSFGERRLAALRKYKNYLPLRKQTKRK